MPTSTPHPSAVRRARAVVVAATLAPSVAGCSVATDVGRDDASAPAATPKATVSQEATTARPSAPRTPPALSTRGFGDPRVGMTPDQASTALGVALVAAEAYPGMRADQECGYLSPDGPDGIDVMITGPGEGTVARVDVNGGAYRTRRPRGGVACSRGAHRPGPDRAGGRRRPGLRPVRGPDRGAARVRRGGHRGAGHRHCPGRGDPARLPLTPPTALRTPSLLLLPLAATVVVFFHSLVDRLRPAVEVTDAVGPGVFCATAAALALSAGAQPVAAVLLGSISGVGGGVLRDVLAG